MYRCERCQGLSQPNEKQNLVVVEVRHKEYPSIYPETPPSVGYETVREAKLCKACTPAPKAAE